MLTFRSLHLLLGRAISLFFPLEFVRELVYGSGEKLAVAIFRYHALREVSSMEVAMF